MATLDGPFPILKLPIEVRWVIYRQLLSNLSIHPCPEVSRLRHDSTRVKHHTEEPDHQTFPTDTIKCSSRHFESLLLWSKWSHVCSSHYEHNTSDLIHFMLACTQIYLESEPFLWSKIDFVIGLPQFCVSFRPKLAIPLRNRFPEFRPHDNILQKLTLVLPRMDELVSRMAYAPRYSNLDARAYVTENIEQSLTILTTECPGLRSVTFIMDASELESDTEVVVPYPYTYIDWILRFKNLKHCAISCSGVLMAQDAGYVSLMYRKHLDICEQVLKEMVTGFAPKSVEAHSNCPTFLIERLIFEDDDKKPHVAEYCGRVARARNVWWEGLPVKEREALVRDEAYKKTVHRQVEEMAIWMLANQL